MLADIFVQESEEGFGSPYFFPEELSTPRTFPPPFRARHDRGVYTQGGDNTKKSEKNDDPSN